MQKLFEPKLLILVLAAAAMIGVAAIDCVEPRQYGLVSPPVALSLVRPQGGTPLSGSEGSDHTPYLAESAGGVPASQSKWSVQSLLTETIEYTSYLPIVMDAYAPGYYYVSKRGNNSNGRSWATAWNELDQINWDLIQPGDTIYLDGGTSQMVYNRTLTIGASGGPLMPIVIKLSHEPGRNGRVVIFGGRSIPLPYCGQTDYTYQTEGVREVGILPDEHSWILIDGTKWRGITIYGHNRNGIWLYGDVHNVVVRNVEIYDNGSARKSSGEWSAAGEGVDLAGTKITFERAIIHDNGQDAFQAGENVADFTLRQSWLYNSRKHPDREEPFNYCTHPDGIQVFGGGTQSGFLIEESIIGPGFMQGVILGQTPTQSGDYAIVNDVTFRNVLFAKAWNANIMGYGEIKSERWVLDHVTAHAPELGLHTLFLEGTEHTVRDSIFQRGNIYLPDGLDDYSGNCQWNTVGFDLGQDADPKFVDVDDADPFSLDDYSLSPTSPCAGKGSSVTSVDQLLSQ